MKCQGLREIFTVTEWRDDCVYRTQSQGIAWITFDMVPPSKDIIYTSISTKLMKSLHYNTMRTVADDTPDVVPVEL